ncbi:hypothetical protein MIMGU_mgv1a018974mg, partial [Erythranthe guttata]
RGPHNVAHIETIFQVQEGKSMQSRKQASHIAKEMIKEAVIEKLDPKTILSGTTTAFRIVDFGCSGLENPTTTTTTTKTLELEFQVFFNDHTTNDFNTLFASLPPDRLYHAAATPGSFHGRLFPRASIQLAHSDTRLTLTLSSGCRRFRKAEEIVSGGLVVLILPGIPDGVRHSEIPANVFYIFLGSSLLDLVNEGIVDKAEVDAFNLPIYAPSDSELRKLIEKNGSFSIERLEVTIPKSQAKIDSSHVHSLIMHFRAALGGIFTKHFGNDVVEKMFDKTLAKSEEISKTLNTIYPLLTHLFVVLKRN